MLQRLNPFFNKLPIYFTTRTEGVSLAPYDSLNLALHTGDNPALVQGNRALICEQLGITPQMVITARQEHGNSILEVDTASVNTWAATYDALPAADALITATRNIYLSILVADCAAVYLYDGKNQAIALLHAGWRSVYQQIIEKTLRLMTERFATQAADCQAYISPSMKSCCFEIQPQTFPTSERDWQAQNVFAKRLGKHYFDLTETIRQRLLQAGLSPGRIQASEFCTVCNQRFFSYRREGMTGRQTALWGLN